jgi:hypothetical protein
MNDKVLEFLRKVSSKITEIEDMAIEYGFEDEFVSCVVIGVVTEGDDRGSLLNSMYSIQVASDEEMERMLTLIDETYHKIKDGKSGEMDSLFGDINLN